MDDDLFAAFGGGGAAVEATAAAPPPASSSTGAEKKKKRKRDGKQGENPETAQTVAVAGGASAAEAEDGTDSSSGQDDNGTAAASGSGSKEASSQKIKKKRSRVTSPGPAGTGTSNGSSSSNGTRMAEDATQGSSGPPSTAATATSTDSTQRRPQRAFGGKRGGGDVAIEMADPMEEQPLVEDTFEEEAHVDVAASAGLQASKAASSDELGGKITLSHAVRHQVAVPPNYPYVPISQHVPPPVPARVYPFELDPFQKVSVASIQRNESVLVSAHTSAGKTVVAEYAIAQCLRDKQRVIYTSPIKALSNQKYREMLAEFGDVGLMTGDVTINPTASCLVMTTEILRSMLYRGSEVMREVAWVVFDEIHYMRDKERGVVWEETIILLPPKVHYVFLSATIPNAMEFAEWICKTHNQPCHVVYTDYRPTPLQHYLFPAGGDGIHLVVDEKGNFREDNFQKAMGALAEGKGEDPAALDAGKGRKGKSKKGGASKGPSDIYKIVKMIMLKQYNPVIVFAFSKKECEGLALQMAKLEFNTDEERDMVANVFESAISGLSEDDRQLPQIEHILPLLKRGIGIHHGGLLPLLKEVIEILFQEGLIKVLFATETFSIGLNMPAKTVVFTNVRKWDGQSFRNLSGGEYIQMSGRAGRRGLDDRGIVIMMCDEKLEPSAAKGMVKGVADRLDSAFHLGYNMVLNLMRVEGVSPEGMLSRCFYQFQSTTSVPRLEKEVRELEDARSEHVIDDEDTIADYYDIRKQLDILKDDLRTVIQHPNYALPFLQPGRLVRVKHESADFGWGCVVNYNKRMGPRGSPLPDGTSAQDSYIVDVLLQCDVGAASTKLRAGQPFTAVTGIRPYSPDSAVSASNGSAAPKAEYVIVPCLLSTIDGISHIRIFLPKDLKPPAAREGAFKNVKEVQRRFADGIQLLDPVANMGIKDPEFKDLLRKIETLEEALRKNALYGTPELPAKYEQYAAKMEVFSQIRAIRKKIQAAESVMHLDELKQRKRVLRRLEFTTSDDVVEMKGRVACEISTGDELLLTELIFHGVFNDLSPEQCAALCSCFVFDEKSEKLPRLREELAGPLRRMQEFARNIAKVSKESKLEISEDEYVQSFKMGLMDAVFQWCKGAKFSEICKMSDVFEGSLIRVFRRLQELLRQMAMAAKVIGNTELEEKFIQSLGKLERQSSVVFNPSLYL